MTGLRLVDKDSGPDPDLAQPPAAPTDLWRAVVDAADVDLAVASMEAAVEIFDEADADDVADYAKDVLIDQGVTALHGSFAHMLTRAARYGGWKSIRRVDQLLHDLPTYDPTATGGLDDVRAGPITLLADREPEHLPTVRLGLPAEFFEISREQRRRWLAWVGDVADAIPVELVAGPIDRHRLTSEHADLLPASVSEPEKRGTPRARARARLAEGKASSAAWSVMRVLARTGAERAPLGRLYGDTLHVGLSESAVRHRVGDMVDAGLVSRLHVDGERHVRLTEAGRAALDLAGGADRSLRTPEQESDDEAPGPNAEAEAELTRARNARESSPSADSGGSKRPREQPPQSPRKDRGRLREHGEPPRPDGEAGVASDAEAAADASPAARTRWLPLWRHHAAHGAAEPGGVTLHDCRDGSLLDRSAPGDIGISTDPDRREVMVSIRFDSTIARTAVRLAAGLASDGVLGKVLSDERVGDRLEHLADGDLPVLRLARQLGWLSEEQTNPAELRKRLSTVSNKLLSDLKDVGTNESFDAGAASSVIRRAHGLAGTVTHILDLLGWDLVRVVDVHDCARNVVDDSAARALGEWMARQTAVCSRHGHYNAFRVLYEDREDKRESMLSAPVIDDPTGDVIGSWVIRGTGADRLDEDLQPDQYLEAVDEDRRNFERFLLKSSSTTADRREATAAIAARLGSFKRLESTKSAVSLLHTMVSPWGAAEALSNLGEQDLGTERPILLDEVRYALGTLDPDRLFPNLCRPGLSKVTSTLLTEQTGRGLSKGELSRLADVERSTVGAALDELTALGFVDVDDLGQGRADLVTLRLPTKDDRGTDDPPRPAFLNGDGNGDATTMIGAIMEAVDRRESVWIPTIGGLFDELMSGSLGEVLRRWPWLGDLLSTLSRLVGPDHRDALAPPGPSSTTWSLGLEPTGRQTAITRSGTPS